MEHNSNTTPMPLTVSESAQENFKDFLKTLEGNFKNSMFKTSDLQLIPRDKCAEVRIPLIGQEMAEEIVTTLATRINVNILYAVSTDNGRVVKVIGYSMPYSDEMYIISIESQQYGVIDEIIVAFYDSLEDMFQEVRHHYLAGTYLLQEPGAFKLEAEDYKTFVSHFV